MKSIFYRAGVTRVVTYLIVFLAFSLFACDHGNKKGNDKQEKEGESLKEPHLKTFTIKRQDAKGGSVTLKGASVTIKKGDVIIDFEEADASKEFTCSENFPLTIEEGKPKTLEFKIEKTAKYAEWKKTVVIKCTTLEILKIAELKVHGLDAKDTLSVELSEEKAEVKEGNVTFHFVQSDAPAHTFEGLPITLKAGKTYKFKIKTQANTKYAEFEKEVTVICKAKGEATEPTLKKITVHDREVKNDKVTILLKNANVTKDNIKLYFDEVDAPKEFNCEPETLILKAGEEKPLKIYTEATTKYKKIERTILIKREEKKELHLKTLTIHGANAATKNVTIKEENVTKNDVKLAFLEDDAPNTFEMSPENLQLAKNDTKKLTISTSETEMYKAWKIEVDVKRAKDDSDPKNIDDVIEALKAQSKWVGSYVDSDVVLLETVEGFAGSTVSYTFDDKMHFNSSGQITRDIADIELEIKATVTWNGQTKTVVLTTTIKRYEKIENSGQYSDGTKYIKTWDFSESNFLKRSYDGKDTNLWEIKSVDVKKRQFVAQLKKKSIEVKGGELLELEDYIKEKGKENRKSFEPVFGASYIELKKKTVITWQDFKAYVLKSFRGYSGLTDEEIFNRLKTSALRNYTGTFADFNALSDAERTKVVKEALNAFKEMYCVSVGISKDTPDEALVEKLAEKLTERDRKEVEYAGQEFKYSYRIESGGTNFEAKMAYDNSKKWCEQNGRYSNSYTTGQRYVGISLRKISDVEISIDLQTKQNENRAYFRGDCLISQSDSFNLDNTEDASIKLQCAVIDAKDGEFNLTTTGGFNGTFKMEFTGVSIESLLW
jgi:hypothetical protein